MDERKGVCLIVGAGDGLGSALVRAFAAEGFVIAMTRRARNLDPLEALAETVRAGGGTAHAYGVDARDETEMDALFIAIERDVGPLEVVVFNIGANVRFGIVETTTRVFQKVWEMACFSGFLTLREAARVMTPRGRGTILVTGATASMRGGKMYSAFASAKAGLRSVAQTAARELGPVGIHVAHIVVDGAIDGVFTRTNNSPDAVQAKLAGNEILKPEDIAANYVWLHNQKPSAWTHELDLRPWKETW